VTSRLPLPVLAFASRALAPLVHLASRRVRVSLRTNLALCFPELGERARRALARRALVQGVATVLELGPLWRWDLARVLALVREVEGREHLEAAHAAGRGVLMIGPHLGAWELAGLYIGANVPPVTSLYRAPRVRGLECVFRSARERVGATLVPAEAGGIRALFRALQRGETVCVLPDQDPGRGGGSIFAPFFGVPANTSTLTARLLESTEAAPLLAWAERLPRGAGFRLHFVPLEREELACGDVERATRALNRALERLVRTCPEQYLWTYRRFRHLPAGFRNPYRHGIPSFALAPFAASGSEEEEAHEGEGTSGERSVVPSRVRANRARVG
jgi:KDO2-lipid IV(A) lauroyltransferase